MFFPSDLLVIQAVHDNGPLLSPGARLSTQPSPRLLPRKLMLTKERPHLPRRVDAVAIPPDHPFRRYTLAARPLMALSLNRVEHHACIVSAVRVLEARD